MPTLFLPAVVAVLLIACALVIVARIQKRLIRTWVASGSQSGTFAPEFSYHLRQWSKEFGLWHDVQRLSFIVGAASIVALIGYLLGMLTIAN
ncbi:MAG: hypothetical protein AAGD43_32480 [Pseudomonadota bacterium]